MNHNIKVRDNIITIESKQPITTDLGNLIFNKEVEEAILLGEKELINNPNDPGIHINLMVAYYKLRDKNKSYFNLSTLHAKKAMINGHNTGLAQKRIVLNLEKELKINQAIDFCNIILDDKFNFSKFGFGDKEYYKVKLEKLNKKLKKSIDQPENKYFTKEEIIKTYRNSTY